MGLETKVHQVGRYAQNDDNGDDDDNINNNNL
jgi:hypothetical protein